MMMMWSTAIQNPCKKVVAPKFWRRIQNLEVRASTILLSPKFGLARKCAFLDQKYCCNVTVWELVRCWM